MPFGTKVARYRRGAGLSLRQLAAVLEKNGIRIDSSGLNRIESGTREPRLNEALALCAALRIPLEDLGAPPEQIRQDGLVASTLESIQEARNQLHDAIAAIANSFRTGPGKLPPPDWVEILEDFWAGEMTVGEREVATNQQVFDAMYTAEDLVTRDLYFKASEGVGIKFHFGKDEDAAE